MRKILLKTLIAVGLIIITPWSIYRINEIYYINFVNEYLPLSKREAVEKLCQDKRIEYLTLLLKYKNKEEKKYQEGQFKKCKIENKSHTSESDIDEIGIVLYPKIPFLSYVIIISFYYNDQIIERYETHAGLEFI